MLHVTCLQFRQTLCITILLFLDNVPVNGRQQHRVVSDEHHQHVYQTPPTGHMGILPNGSQMGTLPNGAHMGTLSSGTHMGTLPSGTHMGTLPSQSSTMSRYVKLAIQQI